MGQNQVPINLMVNLTLTSCGTRRFCLACTASYRGEDILGRANLLISNSIYIITFYGYIKLCSDWGRRVKGSSFTRPIRKTLSSGPPIGPYPAGLHPTMWSVVLFYRYSNTMLETSTNSDSMYNSDSRLTKLALMAGSVC